MTHRHQSLIGTAKLDSHSSTSDNPVHAKHNQSLDNEAHSRIRPFPAAWSTSDKRVEAYPIFCQSGRAWVRKTQLFR